MAMWVKMVERCCGREAEPLLLDAGGKLDEDVEGVGLKARGLASVE